MSKNTASQQALPVRVQETLKILGRNTAVARKRRKESLEAFAARLYVSRPTLKRLEDGDPGVSIGILASALWALGLYEDLAKLGAPERDVVGQAITLRDLPRKTGKATKIKADDDF